MPAWLAPLLNPLCCDGMLLPALSVASSKCRSCFSLRWKGGGGEVVCVCVWEVCAYACVRVDSIEAVRSCRVMPAWLASLLNPLCCDGMLLPALSGLVKVPLVLLAARTGEWRGGGYKLCVRKPACNCDRRRAKVNSLSCVRAYA